ncbi:hypothetical protein [Paractinoplanes atraurantiacus]|uniref:Uncharacterized protein n=1 Tax=Paractinoplanes atraurantiacus TaxID=1036182 RepID=A0A285IS86_9ACTN|nr:hypothetical protein [Actinoplanes atraurantiacus]SNY50824.1 hypothetical protein SAMN05421748_111114 [Actinoplanes atraurantiacus]
MISGGVRAAVRELLQVTGMWLGMGEPDGDGAPEPPRAGALFMAVQTLAAVALGAALAGAWALFFQQQVRTLFLLGYLPLLVPLAIGIARRPAAAAVPLAVALPVGGLAVVAVRAASAGGDGFWWWFLAFAAGALAAGPVFGALSARRPANDRPAPNEEPDAGT